MGDGWEIRFWSQGLKDWQTINLRSSLSFEFVGGFFAHLNSPRFYLFILITPTSIFWEKRTFTEPSSSYSLWPVLFNTPTKEERFLKRCMFIQSGSLCTNDEIFSEKNLKRFCFSEEKQFSAVDALCTPWGRNIYETVFPLQRVRVSRGFHLILYELFKLVVRLTALWVKATQSSTVVPDNARVWTGRK